MKFFYRNENEHTQDVLRNHLKQRVYKVNIIFTDGYLITLNLTERKFIEEKYKEKSLADLMLCFAIDVIAHKR